MNGQKQALKLASNTMTPSPPAAAPPPVPPAPPIPAPSAGRAPPQVSKEPPHVQTYQRSYPPSRSAPPVASTASSRGVKDLGPVGTSLVWLLGLLLFGGGLFAWFFGYAIVEAQLGQMAETFDVMDLGGGLEFSYLEYLDDLDSVNEVASGHLEAAGVYGIQERLQEGRAAGGEGDRWSLPGLGKDWPAMRMTGTIVGVRPEDGSVILDGILVGVGQKREGVRVVQVQSDAAELEYKGERRWILSGQSINQ